MAKSAAKVHITMVGQYRLEIQGNIMSNNIPNPVKIYHIVHIDKMSSILQAMGLLCDAEVRRRALAGTIIGMEKIKQRRMSTTILPSDPNWHVGDCVPFYFCPRSVMLYMFFCDNHPEIEYHGGQEPILHLVADMSKTIQWAKQNNLRWAFTTSNAGSSYFDAFCDTGKLDKIDWNAIQAKYWNTDNVRERKQAEFLIERCFPWALVEEIGVYSETQYR
ncbi:MAG: DUF4433 domain-containing protein, partial [Victivallales bacterium]|nr:DUF4433 domain-containing protein [Victivallales bacterium]